MTRPAAAPAPLTYGPAYLGLYACLTLGVMCNCFLDIQYGHFVFEVTLWALLFGLTLFLGWRQQGVASEEVAVSMQQITDLIEQNTHSARQARQAADDLLQTSRQLDTLLSGFVLHKR